MCLIKSMTTAAMLIVFISRTAYADCEPNKSDSDAIHELYEMFKVAHEDLRNIAANADRNDYNIKDLDNFTKEFNNAYDVRNCCTDLKHMYGRIHHIVSKSISAMLAMGVKDVYTDLFGQLRNTHMRVGDTLRSNHWTTGSTVPFDSIRPDEDIKSYSNLHHNNLRNVHVFDTIENPLHEGLENLKSCMPDDKRKRIVGLLNVQPKMEARNAPLPAESAAGRWEYVDRENRAFHHQQQEPDRLDTPRESVDPLDDMVRQIRVYDKLQEIRNALKRSDKLLVHPVDNDDMREVRAYDQQARPGLVVKRNEFLTNTWVDDDAPDTYYVAAKRDAETLGPFDESGKRSGRLDSLDQALEFKRALQFLELY